MNDRLNILHRIAWHENWNENLEDDDMMIVTDLVLMKMMKMMELMVVSLDPLALVLILCPSASSFFSGTSLTPMMLILWLVLLDDQADCC